MREQLLARVRQAMEDESYLVLDPVDWQALAEVVVDVLLDFAVAIVGSLTDDTPEDVPTVTCSHDGGVTHDFRQDVDGWSEFISCEQCGDVIEQQRVFKVGE